MSMELDEDELHSISDAFKEMGIKPKAKSKQEFQKWLLEFSKGAKPKSGSVSAGQEHQPVSTTVIHPPRLPNYSGDKKGDVTFDLWRFEVDCLKKEKHSEAVISQAIRRSLRGEAARVVMRLGSDATNHDIVGKLQSIYGTIDTKSSVLSEFFSARQREDEDVASWGCRLEDILNKAILLDQVKPSEANDMLRNMLYEGLKPSLQDTTGYIFEKTYDFDELRQLLRRKEEEINKRTKTQHVKSIKTTQEKSDLEELKAMVQKLTADVSEIKKDREEKKVYSQGVNQPSYYHQGRARGVGFNGQQGRPYYRNQQWNAYGGHGNTQRQGYTRFDGRGNINSGMEYPQRHTRFDGQGNMDSGMEHQQNRNYHQNEGYQPVCYRCGQEGHLSYGCRVRSDHMRRLNGRRPMLRRGR